jgi:hypothetical protein
MSATLGTHDAPRRAMIPECAEKGCEQQAAFGRSDRRCFYHGRLADGQVLNGADSRRGNGNRSGIRQSKYPYDDWFATAEQAPVTIAWHADFAADVKEMLGMIRRAATVRDYAVELTHEGGWHGTITIQSARPKEAVA